MIQLTKRGHIILVITLAILCSMFWLLFDGINSFYFDINSSFHIIDLHVKEKKLDGFFDWNYIADARTAYDGKKFLQSFYLIDLLFLIVYTATFFIVSYTHWHTKKMKWVKVLFLTGMILDFLENSSFLYGFGNPAMWVNVVTAFCTSFKSVIFPLNIFLSLVLLFRGCSNAYVTDFTKTDQH